MEKQTDVKLLRNGIRMQLILPTVRDTLRDKQVEAFEALISPELTDEQISHSYFKLPTGFGKTVMFSHMARAYFDATDAAGKKRNKIIIIVPRLSLIDQTQQKLARFADITATEFSGRTKDAKSDVIITTYNSLTKLFGVVDFNDVGLIFADEAHHMLGNKISEQLEFYNKFVPIIGFTATPEYEANRAVANMLDTEIYAMGIPDAVRSGVLNPVKNVLYRSSIVCDLATVPSRTNGDFDYDKLTTKISPDTLATEIARIYADGVDENTGIEFRNLRAIINCPNTKIAELQVTKINEVMGHNVAIALHKEGISDKTFDRLQKEFVSGKYSVACQVNTLTEGFDDVTVAMCINYPTRSRVRAEQSAGRAIRIDENNPDKIAFVVDTIFRATATEKPEDIMYTASNSKQVLFKDIAGDMVLYPENFRGQRDANGNTRRNRAAVEFVDFNLITDTATLVDLKRKADERIADESVPEKNTEWQSANDLAKDKTFPMGDRTTINEWLEKLQPEKPKWIQTRKSGTQSPLCLHRDGREWFLDKLGIKDILPKTDEWQSIYDLQQDNTFPIGNYWIIKKELEKYRNEKTEWIQMRRPNSGQPSLCLHRDGRKWLLTKIGIKDILPKTDEWQNTVNLRLDKTFPAGSEKKIKEALVRFQAEKPEWIQMRRPNSGQPSLCLHRDGREWFVSKLGVVPPKTAEWQSVTDLVADKTFPMALPNVISEWLEKLQPEKPEWIQRRKSGTQSPLCLHRDGWDWFISKLGITPSKTDEWQSILELAKDKTFPMGNINNIGKALAELQSTKPEWIQIRKSGRNTPLCLHRDGRQWLLERIQQEKNKSMQRGATVMGAATNVIDTTATVKSATANKTKKK